MKQLAGATFPSWKEGCYETPILLSQCSKSYFGFSFGALTKSNKNQACEFSHAINFARRKNILGWNPCHGFSDQVEKFLLASAFQHPYLLVLISAAMRCDMVTKVSEPSQNSLRFVVVYKHL